MRMHNLHETDKDKNENENSDEESDEDEEDEDKKPQLELAMMPHYGGINRVRVSLVTFIFTLLYVFIILENYTSVPVAQWQSIALAALSLWVQFPGNTHTDNKCIT